ncbi:MAG: hypothetical protein FWD52_00820 [Candidatus Bathyarchaeota archaeon]|nr:hypothetical protein [Candidatus Termiticorpusculum sp.]
MNVKPNIGSRSLRRKTLIRVSLILTVVVLVSSLFVYRSWVADKDGFIRVKTANELRDAINNAEVGVQVNIALTKDISLGPALSIPAGADITLTSVGGDGFFRLIGLNGQNVITVEKGGLLTLDGIIVTHETGSTGGGVVVENGGTLIMVDGEITGNTATWGSVGSGAGGGVHIKGSGVFELMGGVILGNTAYSGGGIYNEGTFKMSSGLISDNAVTIFHGNNGFGGGVYNCRGTFTMSGGEISNNKADSFGGGLYNYCGTFDRSSGGEILGNTAEFGNDIYQLTE